MKINDLLKKIEIHIPKENALANDNCGLQIGNPKDTIKGILLALECNLDALNFAKENNLNLIIAHHPLIYKPLNSILPLSYQGQCISYAIKNNISILALHTNADASKDGLNDYLAEKLSLISLQTLSKNDNTKFVKLVTFIPENYLEKVQEAIFNGKAGHIGNYSHCSFNCKGTGTFLPLEGTNPYIGKQGVMEKTSEIRFETIINKRDIADTLNRLKSAHPYEEIAYDLYPLSNIEATIGLGRLCKPKKDGTLFSDILNNISQQLDIDFFRYNGKPDKEIKRIALCTGSGGSFIRKLSKIDLIITGDISYHDAVEALQKDIAFVDIGHDQEKLFIPYMHNLLKKIGFSNKILEHIYNYNPFKVKMCKEMEL